MVRHACHATTHSSNPLARATWLSAVLLSFSCSAQAACPPRYDVQVFNHPCGGVFADSQIIPYGINDADPPVVVGMYRDCFTLNERAFRWTPAEGLTTLSVPAGTESWVALDVNDAGVIVGYHRNFFIPLNHVACMWDQDTFTVLGALPTTTFQTEAHGISADSTVVGYSNGISLEAFIWSRSALAEFGPLLGGPNTVAYDINDNNWITGWAGKAPHIDASAFIVKGREVIELPPIPGGFSSDGRSINNNGDVAGVGRVQVSPDVGEWQAYAYLDGRALNLGSLPGSNSSVARALNDNQVIVGVSSLVGGFVWLEGTMYDLSELVADAIGPLIVGVDGVGDSHGVNKRGQIIATGVLSGDRVAFLLTPRELDADLDRDGSVDGLDLMLLLQAWGACARPNSCAADLDCNGLVNGFDLAMLLGEWR